MISRSDAQIMEKALAEVLTELRMFHSRTVVHVRSLSYLSSNPAISLRSWSAMSAAIGVAFVYTFIICGVRQRLTNDFYRTITDTKCPARHRAPRVVKVFSNSARIVAAAFSSNTPTRLFSRKRKAADGSSSVVVVSRTRSS